MWVTTSAIISILPMGFFLYYHVIYGPLIDHFSPNPTTWINAQGDLIRHIWHMAHGTTQVLSPLAYLVRLWHEKENTW